MQLAKNGQCNIFNKQTNNAVSNKSKKPNKNSFVNSFLIMICVCLIHLTLCCVVYLGVILQKCTIHFIYTQHQHKREKKKINKEKYQWVTRQSGQ